MVDPERHPVSIAASSAVLESARKSTGDDTNKSRERLSHHTPAGSASSASGDNHHRSATGMASEHGHSYGIDALHRIAPMAVHSGSSVAQFFNGLFQTILAIGTLGASITFNYVLSNASPSSSNGSSASNSGNSSNSNTLDSPVPTTGGEPRFSATTVQLFLSVSWLLFLLALAFASLGQTLLTFFRKHWERDWDGKHGRTSQVTVQWYAVLAAVVMGGLVIAAFCLLCLVVVAYSPVVGWIALGFTAFFGGIIAVAIANQVPWPCNWREPVAIDPQERTARKRSSHDLAGDV
jgi:hypothetical protein